MEMAEVALVSSTVGAQESRVTRSDPKSFLRKDDSIVDSQLFDGDDYFAPLSKERTPFCSSDEDEEDEEEEEDEMEEEETELDDMEVDDEDVEDEEDETDEEGEEEEEEKEEEEKQEEFMSHRVYASLEDTEINLEEDDMLIVKEDNVNIVEEIIEDNEKLGNIIEVECEDSKKLEECEDEVDIEIDRGNKISMEDSDNPVGKVMETILSSSEQCSSSSSFTHHKMTRSSSKFKLLSQPIEKQLCPDIEEFTFTNFKQDLKDSEENEKLFKLKERGL